MGLLADVYSYGDTLKRNVRGLLDDPAGTLALGVTRFGEDMAKQTQNQALAYGVGGLIAQDPANREQAARELADFGAQSGMAAATVWHGSPHKFNKFDSSKIGTGEGAQAYGHGLYLAETPDVATSYSNMRAAPNMEFHTSSGRKLVGLEKAIADDITANGLAAARINAKANGSEWLDAFERIKGETITRGNLYKVDLPDEHIAKMLDWDKPLGQQPQEMQMAWEKVMSGRIGRSADKSNHGYLSKREGQFADPTGKTLHDVIAEGLIGVGKPRPFAQVKEEATDFLRRQGIPGIRYLDGGSRGAGQGTSNYVVFPGNEGLLTILERNGQPLR